MEKAPLSLCDELFPRKVLAETGSGMSHWILSELTTRNTCMLTD
jgi:hypothetical protein